MTGFICIDKPQDITSFLAVNKVRRIVNEKKVGHSGTLDPMATGVLFAALGGATRFLDFLPNHEKSYNAQIKMGITTDTLDITGKVLKEEKTDVSREQIENILPFFEGKIKQLPPMYSALKKDGKRLYDLARQGIEVEREEREVEIKSIELADFDGENQEFSIEVQCSGGTYIRTLSEDIGKKLGVPAVLKKLVRTKANGFTLEKCVSLESLKNLCNAGETEKCIISVEEVMKAYPSVTVSEAQATRFFNGGELSLDRIKCKTNDGLCRVYSPDKRFLGLGEVDRSRESLFQRRVYIER